MRSVVATRYVTPLREGGSLPALVEAADDGLYVLKFRGAGQGPKALVAEVVCGELGRALGLPIPELVLAQLDPALGRAEPDPEIQELIEASGGINLGVDFLPGSLAWDPETEVAPELSADVVWFDALCMNVDRSPRNPNLLVWHRGLWLIDHGAALYVHHAWEDPAAEARRAFPPIRDHVLLGGAGSVLDADARLAARVDRAMLEAAVGAVPGDWLEDPARRADYVTFLETRLREPRAFAAEAEEARAGR